MIHYIHGPAGLVPALVAVTGDNISWTYSLTVPAGQTVRLAYFTILGTTQAAAVAAANTLLTASGFGGQAAAFLTPAEIQSLANFGPTSFNSAPVLTAASPSLGITAKTKTITIGLSGTFINHGPGTTTITDPDFGAVCGRDCTGGNLGWWDVVVLAGWQDLHSGRQREHRLRIIAAQHGSALLYAGGNGRRTATITYCAWDTSGGTPGSKVDTSSSGGTTAFSPTTDTASLAIDGVLPSVTSVTPSLAGRHAPCGHHDADHHL